MRAGELARGTVHHAQSRVSRDSGAGEELAHAVIEQLEISTKYAGYITKQQDEVQRAAAYEQLKLPVELDYMQVTALSFEARRERIGMPA